MTAEYYRQYRKRNAARLKELDRKYFERNKDRIYSRIKAWRKKRIAKQREYDRAYYAKYRRDDPVYKAKSNARRQKRPKKAPNRLRDNARAKCKRAINCGKLQRPSACESCGVKCKPNAHHHDYSKPLSVQWLCVVCHGMAHRRELPQNEPFTYGGQTIIADELI